MKRLYEVRVETVVYVFAETEHDAERIACSRTPRDWLDGWVHSAPVEPSEIACGWRNELPLVDYREPDVEETCVQIAEREKREREFAARQAVLSGVMP